MVFFVGWTNTHHILHGIVNHNAGAASVSVNAAFEDNFSGGGGVVSFGRSGGGCIAGLSCSLFVLVISATAAFQGVALEMTVTVVAETLLGSPPTIFDLDAKQ